MEIEIELLSNGQVPVYQTPGSAGADLHAAISTPKTLAPGDRYCVPTGIKIAIPEGYEGQVRPRSGLAIKAGITVVNAPGTIDFDFRNEVGVILINHGHEDFVIEPDMRIAQLVIAPVVKANFKVVKKLGKTSRAGGFGSTGVY